MNISKNHKQALIALLVTMAMLVGGVFMQIKIHSAPKPVTIEEQQEEQLPLSLFSSIKDEKQEFVRDMVDCNIHTVNAFLDLESNQIVASSSIVIKRQYPGKREVVLNLYPNNIDKNLVNITGVTVNRDAVPFEVNSSELVIYDDKVINRNDVVKLDFTLDIPQGAGLLGRNENNALLSHWIPTIAVYKDDKWQQVNKQYPVGDSYYNESALYQVMLNIPKGYQVASTGVIVDKKNDADRDVITIQAGPVRDFAVFVQSTQSDCYSITSKQSETVLKFWPGKLLDKERTEAGLITLEKALEYMETNVGDYPYKEMDFVIYPLKTLDGMEFSNLLVLDEKMAKGAFATIGIRTTVHELIHEWFYNLIGNNQISEPWLDEALTTFMTNRFSWQELNYESKVATLRKSVRALVKNRVWSELDDFESRWVYLNSVYHKGALMLHELDLLLGYDNMNTLLKQYYQKNYFTLTDSAELILLAEELSKQPLRYYFTEWLLHPDIPLNKGE